MVRDLFLARPSTSRLQLDSLDGLRGIAALAVFLAHLEGLQLSLLPMGVLLPYAKPAVYLFFSLSAFLLTLIWLRSATPMTARTCGRYALRRTLRVLPLYLVVLLFTAASTTRWPGYQSPILRDFSMANVPGHLLFMEGDGVFWTVAVEFRYYLLLPLVVLLLLPLRGHRGWAIGGTAALLGASLVLWPSGELPFHTLSLIAYLPIFVLGSLAAFVHWSWVEPSARASRGVRVGMEGIAWASLAGVIALNGMLWAIPGNPAVRSLYFGKTYWIYGLLWSVFLVAHLHGTGGLQRLLSWGPLRFLGAISFSVYLLHLPVIFAVRSGFAAPGPLPLALTVVGVIGLSTLTYLVIERPFLRLGSRRASPRVAPA